MYSNFYSMNFYDMHLNVFPCMVLINNMNVDCFGWFLGVVGGGGGGVVN